MKPITTPLLLLPILLALPAQADQYTLALTSASTFTGNANLTVNFAGSFKGNYDQTTNLTGTRTINGLFGGSTGAPNNQAIAVNNSSATGSGTPATSPRGSVVVRYNSFSNTVELLGLAVDAIGPSPDPTIALSATLALPNFRTFAPNYTYPLFNLPFTIPLGNAVLTDLTFAQDAQAVTIGTPRAGGGVDFTISVPVRVLGSVTFQGTPNAIDLPQVLVLTGTLIPSGTSATGSVSFTLNATQPIAPVPADPANPIPFPLPAPSAATPPPPPANILLTVGITGGSTTLGGTGNLPTAGPRTSIADVSSAGQLRRADGQKTADDIIVFLNAFFAGDALADVSGPGQSTTPDGQFTADDIIVFLNAFFAA